MATNLVESIQKNLGFPELHKIDPNTQGVKSDESTTTGTKTLAQAAIPAVLTGLYKYGSTDAGSEEILSGHTSSDWLDVFFSGNKEEAIQKVATYAGTQPEEANQQMRSIASEAIRLIRENTPEASTFANVKSYIVQQRNNILMYLPAELQMSSLVGDNTLDDRTNKMEGPMSNSMHFIEKLFSGSTTEKYERTKDEDEQKG